MTVLVFQKTEIADKNIRNESKDTIKQVNVNLLRKEELVAKPKM